MSDTLDYSESDNLDESENSIIDGANYISENSRHTINSGETIPLSIDSSLLAALENFNADDFETKLYPVNKAKKESKFFKGNSKFFVKTEEDNQVANEEDLMQKAKQEWKSTNLSGKNLINLQTTDIVEVDKNTKREFILNLNDSINEIRNFLVHDTTPTQLALSNAFDQSKQTLESILGVKVDSSSKQIEAMITDAIKLKTFEFIADKLKLTTEQKQIIINKYYVITVPTINTNRIVE